MTTAPNELTDLVPDLNASDQAAQDRGLRARQTTYIAARAAGFEGPTTKPRLIREFGSESAPRANGQDRDMVGVGNGSPFVSPDGQLCGLFAVDIAGFNGSQRDDDIQMYVHESLYDMLQVAFDRSEVPWNGCAHEDRGDGVLVVIPPMIPIAGLVDPIPQRLRSLIRRHNRVSCEAARIQLRIATHAGPVHHDGHGFVGHAVTLLYRLLDTQSLKRMLAQSGADIGFIASGYIYENVIRRRPSLIDPALFQSLPVRVKETRTRAWAYLLGT